MFFVLFFYTHFYLFFFLFPLLYSYLQVAWQNKYKILIIEIIRLDQNQHILVNLSGENLIFLK